MKSVCWCVLVFSLNFVYGQDWVSVCPDVFEYENITNLDLTRGRITVLKPDDDKKSVSTLEVRINFTIAGPIIDEYRGHVTATTTNLVRKYNRKDPLVYRVHFPRTELPPPKVTGVIINGFAVCFGPGDDSGLSKSIKNLSIKHRSSDGTNMRVTSPPVTNTAEMNPLQPWPAVTSTPGDAGFSNTAITTDEECGVVAGGNERVPLIHNGKFYDRGEVPWLVAIYRVVENNLQFICAGTLVSDRHVVTAAHCMQRPFVVTPITEIVVKAGVHSLNDWGDDLTVIRKLLAGNIHEEYDPNTLQNDILILTLNKRVKSNRYIRPACLWSGDTELSRVVGASGVVAGWGDRGAEHLGGKPDEPQMVRVPIVSTRECRASRPDFHRLTYDTTLCAGDRNGAGPCKGDSGGGLYLLEGGKWRLRGVVSVSLQSDNGARICNLNDYVVYTDTAQFLPWIRNILSIKYYD